ncbi:hypothetical protein MFLAVUS_011222 [Mucor flavus]|uniref:C2H2-type domain-containing protein n=1 Tax=Mucor flavus TaxID=439312 RepID=A0ABP9ZF00_9FUNG
MSSNLSASRATKRLRVSHNNHICDTCGVSFETYRQLNNHNRNHVPSRVADIIDDTPMQDDDNDFNNDDVAAIVDFDALRLNHNEERSYKSSCEISEDDESHVYSSNNITENSFTKAQLLSVHLSQIITRNQISRAAYREIVMFINTALRDYEELRLEETPVKISHGDVVNDLLKSKLKNIKGHEYSVCPTGCKLYGLNDTTAICEYCNENRFKGISQQAPKATISILSIGDILSQMISDPKTNQLLKYRAERETNEIGEISDIFDGQNYKDLVRKGFFTNPNDIAIGLFTDGFVNQKKGKTSYTIVHVIH